MSNQVPASVFDALGDPVRRRILEVLGRGPSAVGPLAAQLPVGRPAVSKHLRVLTDVGLVAYRRQGTRHLYVLAPEGMVEAQRWLTATWDTVLAAFATEVATLAPTETVTPTLAPTDAGTAPKAADTAQVARTSTRTATRTADGRQP
jgi:DNA-binding transcriptional ArsR family regulator